MRRFLSAAAIVLAAASVSFVAGPVSASTPKLKVPVGLKGVKGVTPALIRKWNALVTAAKAEGKITIVSSGDLSATGIAPFYNAFGSEFGISVTLVGGSPTAISNRILAERQQGVHAEDIATAGQSTMMRLIAGGSFQPLRSSLIIPLNFKKGWYYNKFPWCDVDVNNVCVFTTLQPGVTTPQFYYNTQLVNPNKIKTWDDLLKPEFKGKIVMGNVAQGVDSADMVRSWHQLGPKYFTKLMAQNPTVLPPGGDVTAVNGLARGQWTIAMFPGDSAPYLTAISQGLPIQNFTNKIKPVSLATLGQRTGILAQAPDPAAAELYANWMLSPDGQAAFNKYDSQVGQVALRTDVPRGNIPGTTWFPALRTKSVYLTNQHPNDLTNATAWWTQEFAKLGIH